MDKIIMVLALLLLVITSCEAKDIDRNRKLLLSDNPEFRTYGAYNMGEKGPLGVIYLEELIDTLEDEDYFVRSAAVTAIGKIGMNDDDTILALKSMLSDENPYVRYQAIGALEKLGIECDNDEFTLLTECLGHPDPEIKISSIGELLNLGMDIDPVISIIIELLQNDNDKWVKINAAWILSISGKGERVVDALVESLLDEDFIIRTRVWQSFENLGSEDTDYAVHILLEYLEDERTWVRDSSIWALYHLGPNARDALPNLREIALNDPDEENRWAAREAIIVIEEGMNGAEDDE